jgi:oligopeptide transport system substrate-binding protein
MKRRESNWRLAKWRARVVASVLLIIPLTGGCFLDHEVEPFYGRVSVPRAQEFRWSNGGLPQTLDPALAAAPPDTDVIRAMFEGLTDYDPKTLTPVPAVAERWESTPDNREWVFHLRRDARWSNGEPVTAQDFVNSWKRTLKMGETAPHARLLANIAGAVPPPLAGATGAEQTLAQAATRAAEKKEIKTETKKEKTVEPPAPPPFGAEALDDYTLRVRLMRPDANFPALVAHPVFRPVHGVDAQLPSPMQAQRVVSNGAFQFSRASRDGVTLERAGNYWDAQSVSLQRVQFVASQNTEAALSAYRAGEVDAVTNAGFEPLAIKLLSPYKDFHRTTYGAITFYSFNTSKAPFDDVRVREALAIVIDRDRICEDEMGGATEPAQKFLPEPVAEPDHAGVKPPALEKNITRAQSLLAAAGFPQGKGFPQVRLLINRNEQQRQVAESIKEMWRSALGIDAVVLSKPWDEYEAAARSGDYDVVRRGFVMQTTDEETNMRLMFDTSNDRAVIEGATSSPEKTETPPANVNANQAAPRPDDKRAPEKSVSLIAPPVLSEQEALRELPAIPIYFASSYQLIKPYVVGFDSNLLDAPSLKRVRIDTGWQQPKQTSVAWFK